MVDYRHPRRAKAPASGPAAPPGAPPAADPDVTLPRQPSGGVDYSHPRRRSASPAPATRPPAAPPRLPRPSAGGGVDYSHPRRLPQGAVPDSTRGGVGGPGWQVYTYDDGEIVRFDPERVIGVRLNVDQAGRWAEDDVEAALWHVAQATGLRFEFDGYTARIPQADDYARSDPRRPTLTIAWAKPGRVPGGSDLLDPDELHRAAPADRPRDSQAMAVGVGGWHVEAVVAPDGTCRRAITTAMVVIDSSVRELFPPGFGVGSCRGAVLLHEIAHAVGIGHVDDPAQLMYPVVTDKPAAYGPGDLEALRRVGAAAGPLPVLRTPR